MVEDVGVDKTHEVLINYFNRIHKKYQKKGEISKEISSPFLISSLLGLIFCETQHLTLLPYEKRLEAFHHQENLFANAPPNLLFP